ncbi:GCN5 family acetyltransferase [Thiomicrospira aerophila AL3]|uniref:GCN5 family acetyltransferase n=1 Tax=Thiomicrospira aerophila AL3 TaxID=717772 RepID=W0DV71_9GAMM|nr:GCN5 family acetyltransferase [Thiomicrospira aerophila AL3]
MTHNGSFNQEKSNYSLHHETIRFSPKLAQLCKQAKQRKPQQGDQVFWLEHDSQALGLLRLRPLDGPDQGWLLRGLWVHPAWREQGLGSYLVASAIKDIQNINPLPIYAMATNQLDGFYQRLGFERLMDHNSPTSLQIQSKWQIWIYPS